MGHRCGTDVDVAQAFLGVVFAEDDVPFYSDATAMDERSYVLESMTVNQLTAQVTSSNTRSTSSREIQRRKSSPNFPRTPT